MKKVSLHLEIADITDEVTEDQLRGLMSDALAEFINPRRDARKYVHTRYFPAEDYVWMDREKKILEVRSRVRLAEKLRRAVARCEPEVVVEVKEDDDDIL